jgi:hypothetical protein
MPRTGDAGIPEYQIHLNLYEEEMLEADAEVKLHKALWTWIESAPNCDDSH